MFEGSREPWIGPVGQINHMAGKYERDWHGMILIPGDAPEKSNAHIQSSCQTLEAGTL